MNIKELNEQLEKLLEEKEYELKIITGRGRGEDGEITTDTFQAKNDAEALLYVFTNYDLQNSGYLNGEYEEDGDLEEEDLEKINKIKQAAKTGKNVQEAVKLMTDIYFDGLDISDYYDDIVYLTAPDGHIVIEDDINTDEWFGDDEWDEEDDDWEEDEDAPMLDDISAWKKKTVEYKTFAEWFGKDLTGQTYNGDINYSEKDIKLTSLKGAPKIFNGNFEFMSSDLKSLEYAPEKVNGDFNCSHNKLTSLKGAPKEVKGDFDCGSNKLTSLQGAPKEVGGDFICYECGLTSLEGVPQTINGSFNCSNNELKSLNGAPTEVNGDFRCDNNPLTSLEGSPRVVRVDFICYNADDLQTLKGAPEVIGGDFICRHSEKLTSIEGLTKPENIGGYVYLIGNETLMNEAKKLGYKVK